MSGDRRRVLSAVWTVVRSREGKELDPLVNVLPKIRRATDCLDLGGMLHSNRLNLDHALEKIEHYRDGQCWCASYPGLLLYEPEAEERAGHVTILSTSEPGWEMTYVCRCEVCQQEFDVKQGNYHYMWWEWVPRGVRRKKR